MKGIVKLDKGISNVKLLQIEEPELKGNFLKIKIHAAGICGTDLHIISDEYPYNAPVVLGHEYSGTVVEKGDEVTEFAIGDRIVSLTAASTCKRCEYCENGLYMLCENKKSIGSQVNGAFAEYLYIPKEIAYKIPEGVSMDEAALSEPLACVVRCVMERSKIQSGDLVFVSGPGTIGLLSALVAIANGGRVVLAGTPKDEERLEFAKSLSTQVIDTVTLHSEKDIELLKQNYKFDVAIECAGHEGSLDNCINVLKKQGSLIQVGLYGKKISINSDLMLMKELTYTNGYASEPSSWRIALNLLESKLVNVKPLITHKIPLEEWEEAIELAKSGQGFKLLLVPDNAEVYS